MGSWIWVASDGYVKLQSHVLNRLKMFALPDEHGGWAVEMNVWEDFLPKSRATMLVSISALGEERSHENTKCDHGMDFWPEGARGMSVFEVKQTFPRFEGTCKRCGFSGVDYVSALHKAMGDWHE